MNFKSFIIFFMMFIIAFAIVGCKYDDLDVLDEYTLEKGNDITQYLNLILDMEPSTLDPSKGTDMYSNTILINVLEPLTRLEEDEESKNILVPAGAESWEHNEDGTVWTFKIRNNLWSDGKEVRAQDYEYGIKRTVAKETASQYAYLLSPIKNAMAINQGKLPIEELGVKCLDDKTLEITLASPTPYFLELTYQRVMFPQREDIVKQHGEKHGSEQDTLIFNGPFTLSSWAHNSELILEKNYNYWDKDNVKLENVNLFIIQDSNAAYNSLANATIDQISANKTEWREKFLQDEDLKHYEIIEPSTNFLFFNTKDKLFSNVNVRKAFSLAINREELADVIFNGVNVPAYGWVSPGISIGENEYRDIIASPVSTLISENPDPKALLRRGLTELGMDSDPSKTTVKMSLGSTDQETKIFGEYLQQVYMKVLGINFIVEQMEWPVFMSVMDKGDFQIGSVAWAADFNDPASTLTVFKSDAGILNIGWANPRFDELIDMSDKEMDPAKRVEYLSEAEKILLYDESVIAPMTYSIKNIFAYKYVNNIGITPFGTSGFKYAFTSGR